eukprot:19678-Rhodomonas_salina.6
MAGIGTIMKADEAQGQVQRFRDDDLEQEPDQRLREGEFQTLHLGTQRVYSGQTLDGVPYGLGAEFGEMIAVPAPVQIEEAGVGPPKQAVYLGGFREGAKDGWGVDCLANGERFVGWCASGERSGMGVSESDKEQYRGEWDHGLRHGFGVCVYAAKNMVYAGFWRRGAKHGRGLWMVAEPSRSCTLGDDASNIAELVQVFLSKNGARLRENSDGGHPGRQKAEIEQMINEYDAVLKDALAQVKAAVTNASTDARHGQSGIKLGRNPALLAIPGTTETCQPADQDHVFLQTEMTIFAIPNELNSNVVACRHNHTRNIPPSFRAFSQACNTPDFVLSHRGGATPARQMRSQLFRVEFKLEMIPDVREVRILNPVFPLRLRCGKL